MELYNALQQRDLADVKDDVSLYVLSQVIATQSADVERGFLLLNHCLGLNRLSTKTGTLVCRLRAKQSLPKPISNRVEATQLEAELESLGVELDSEESTTDQDKSGPNAVEIFRQLSLPNGMKPWIQTLQEKLGIDRSAIWEELAEDFDAFDEVNMHDTMLEDTRECDEQDDSLKEKERLLKEGQ
jgi:hypothetical protein